ncbi:carboxypeptidase regulatory-like domain-containing protein [Algoriphagus sp.]|uniref:carboxypeptidase regulatory-like domain-containing protein n=1 Tax=Algoriphagus sp. TaxID=1872435 RepID=UPI0025DAA787|nr:carboxypeptidase regulatory-like domain-containing protein [Algoriphagus sp.]
MKMFLKLIGLFLIVLTMSKCKPYVPEGQGIIGTVTWIEGNQMPMIQDGEDPSKEAKKVERSIQIYPLTNIADVKVEEGLITSIASKKIKEVKTDGTGKYAIDISPGRYTILTVEENGLFANIFDGEGNIQPVTVKENEWTLVDILINYKAFY